MKLRLSPFFLVLLIISCTTQEVCDDNSDSELVVRFKTLASETIIDTIISDVTLYGIMEGEPDSLLANSAEGSRFVLPLDPHNYFSRFVLKINEQSDTLLVSHTTEYYMISYNCGFATLFTMEEDPLHSGTMIDSLEIINAVIDVELEQDEEHLWIYF